MTADSFLSRCLILDLELGRDQKIYHLGAVLGDAVLDREGRVGADALSDLDAFGARADFVLGHNVARHDLPFLQGLAPDLALLRKPIVDTLFLSPLAFPEYPYHRLVKDYKLVRDTVNDPVADARLAAQLFRDEWAAFAARIDGGEGDLVGLHRFCFDPGKEESLLGRGLVTLFDALGAPVLDAKSLGAAWLAAEDRACRTGLREIGREFFPRPGDRRVLAYAAAWLRVAGGDSVLPPWVRRELPEVARVLSRLRDEPCADGACTYCREVQDPRAQLKRYFDFSEFRARPEAPDGTSLQEEVVRLGLGGTPLLAILPTGGGKSLCFQLPALARHWRRGFLTVVISPLQALMKDQVDNLAERTGTPQAAALYGMLTPPERGDVLERVRMGDIAILYVSPEQLRNKTFHDAISHREVGAWVFDEAHCLSKWGHDFRPDYLYAARFIREFADEQGVAVPPVACFTATAKPDVREEILAVFAKELGQELRVFEAGVERENLAFEVHSVGRAEKFARIHELLTERLPEGAGAVVYTSTRNHAEEIARFLQNQGIDAAPFHAGLEAPEKRSTQDRFLAGEVPVICATNAFGMGVDKGNIRLVIHAQIPGSLENYLQEAGRAGRDQDPAQCVLLFDEEDIETQFRLEGFSRVTRSDIIGILRAVKRRVRKGQDKVVVTSGELLRDGDLDSIDPERKGDADTKVKASIAWLERAGFVERDENRTGVFQGKPLVKSLQEAEARIARLKLSPAARDRWLALLNAVMNAEPDEGISADDLAALSVFKGTNGDESPTAQVLRILHQMSEAGILRRGLYLTAYVRPKGRGSAREVFEAASAVERGLLELLPEIDPDADQDRWVSLTLRTLNQRLLSQGLATNPELLRNLLKSLSQDGRGLAGTRGSLLLRHRGLDRYEVKLQRSWKDLTQTADLRRSVASVALDVLGRRVPEGASSQAEILVEFAAEDIIEAVNGDLLLRPRLRDPLAAVDRALLYLHEHGAIILQHGLAVFRQAMTLRVLEQPRPRQYTKGDYEPLAYHYREKVFQVHVMYEYARLALEAVREAKTLVREYFREPKERFVARFFGDCQEILERATSGESFRRIVDGLNNPAQTAIVAAPEERNTLILAGPGSGKTRVVVHRCAYLLRVVRVPPQAILVVCFNRGAALTVRKRLRELVGNDAFGVTVQTYHGLALRLVGRSFAGLAEVRGREPIDFDGLVREAVALLRGEAEAPGLEPDELRDRLLAGYRHILVDEYQDIDEDQYALISALAGRTLDDVDRKLGILAVGDDDQSIYGFRGANVTFLRRFQEDYGAKVHHLTENYRSSGYIIAAANHLIRANRDRMKVGVDLSPDRRRKRLPAGGAWDERDPLARGRVQILQLGDRNAQAPAVVDELRRIRGLDPEASWDDFAVLARQAEDLAPIRAACEHAEIPVRWGLERGAIPLNRVREVATFLEALKERRAEALSTSDLIALLGQLQNGGAGNPWWRLTAELVDAWGDEAGGGAAPVSYFLDFAYEALGERRRGASVGEGVYLGTVHAAKGTEYRHVFVPDGGWRREHDAAAAEEELRVYYVAMTRARETLTLIEFERGTNPHPRALNGDFTLRRRVDRTTAVPDEVLSRRYALWDLDDLYLGYAGRRPAADPVHRALSALTVGSRVQAREAHGRIYLEGVGGQGLARLSNSASAQWKDSLTAVEEIRVVALVRQDRETTPPEFREDVACDAWEVPLLEVVHRSPQERT